MGEAGLTLEPGQVWEWWQRELVLVLDPRDDEWHVLCYSLDTGATFRARTTSMIGDEHLWKRIA